MENEFCRDTEKIINIVAEYLSLRIWAKTGHIDHIYKGPGCINLEIAFTYKINKKKNRRYVNTNQYISKDVGSM